MAERNQDRVAAAIWRWREDGTDRSMAEERQRLQHSLVQSTVMLVVGLIFLFACDFRIMGTIALSLAAIVFLSARLVPALYRGIETSVALTARAIGTCVTWLVLVPFFYICFVPGRLFMLITGKDPLHRKCPSKETTYWLPRKPSQPDHYERQY